MNCSIHPCEKPAEKRAMCGMHYRRWRVHGDASITKKAANGAGYLQGGYPGHQVNGVRKFTHVEVAERSLGRPLPSEAVVHHVDEDRTNNSPTNLVICPSRTYHNLIHARMRAYDATGDADAKFCRHCGQYDAPVNLRKYEKKRGTGQFVYSHAACDRTHNNTRKS